jgi:hypothetical protein
MEFEFDEEFKTCSFNPSLEVSQYGRVKDKSGKILEQIFFNGYMIMKDPSLTYPFELVHRLVALTWRKDEYKKGMIVHHIDGDRLNNRVDNLEWKENLEHAQAHGWSDVDEFGTWIMY